MNKPAIISLFSALLFAAIAVVLFVSRPPDHSPQVAELEQKHQRATSEIATLKTGLAMVKSIPRADLTPTPSDSSVAASGAPAKQSGGPTDPAAMSQMMKDPKMRDTSFPALKRLGIILHSSPFESMHILPCNAASGFRLFLMVCFVLGFLGSAVAREKKLDEFDSPSKLKPGTTGLLQAPAKGMKYFLKVPRKYDARNGARLLVFLHGSNMNGLDYLKTIEANKWADEDIICCPNGENGSDPYGQNNFSQGSGPLVAAVTGEVQKALKTTVTYVGGHSQRGFLTYNVVLNYPDLYQGAFPMAGDCWMQNEPNLWEGKPDVLQKQRQIPIAVIHGKEDPVVQFSQGEHAYDCFRAMGWTKLRLFAPGKLNHMFGIAPIDEALEWLETVNGRNEKKGLNLAKKWAKDGEWGWVRHAVKGTPGAAGVEKAAEDAAAKALPTVLEAMKGNPKEWVPKWIEFWRIHGESAAAKTAVEDYLRKRAQKRGAAAELFGQSQAAFRSSNQNEAYLHLEKLLETGAHTYQGYFACKMDLEEKVAQPTASRGTLFKSMHSTPPDDSEALSRQRMSNSFPVLLAAASILIASTAFSPIGIDPSRPIVRL